MTYAAAPYPQFVDDLLISLTGGVVRERFTFVPEEAPFRLAPPAPMLPSTLQLFGQAAGEFRRFRVDVDYSLGPDGVITWRARKDGSPAADAVWPDEQTDFFANYDTRTIGGSGPLLTDRNRGSVTRLLAESFAREFAVLSRQLEAVYRAGFIGTSTGRDLDQLVALVGIERRNATFAVGSVVFGRPSPAPADIFIPVGTRLSTAEPPVAVFETTEDRTIQRGNLSVEVPVSATVAGAAGVVDAGAIIVIHRPILGVEGASNPQGTRLGGGAEPDPALRARARLSLEGSGKATQGALLAALTSLPGVREKDARLDEDPIKRPGVVTLKLAASLDDAQAKRAVELIEATRPIGVRVLHDLDTPETVPSISPAIPEEDDRDDETDADATASQAGLFFPVVATAVLLPSGPALTPEGRTALKRQGEAAINAIVADAGIGETLVYNRLVAALMAIDGVLDVSVELYPVPTPVAAVPGVPAHPGRPSEIRRRNLKVPRTQRPTVNPAELGSFAVDVGGELVALDVTVTVTLKGLAVEPGVDPEVSKEDVRQLVAADLRDRIVEVATLSPASLRGLLAEADTFAVTGLTYQAELIDAGIRVHQQDVVLTLGQRQRPWIRVVELEESR